MRSVRAVAARMLSIGALSIGALSIGALSCSSPSGNDLSGPGTVRIRFETPNSDDGAIKLLLSGPGISAIGATGDLMVFSRLGAGGMTTIAAFGDLADGFIVTFDVPDRSDLDKYSATLLEVSGPDNALRGSLTGYKVTVEY